MKKIINICLMVFILLGVTACSNKDEIDGTAIYEEAVLKTSLQRDRYSKIMMVLTMGSGDDALEMITDIEAWIRNDADPANMEMIMNNKSSMLGYDSLSTVYAKDGEYYLASEYGNYKVNEGEISIYTDELSKTDTLFTSNLISNIKATKVEGGYNITFAIDKKALAQLTDQDTSALMDKVMFKNLYGNAFVGDDGLVHSTTIRITFTISESGYTLETDLLLTVENEPLTEEYVFEFPDFSSFETLDYSSIIDDLGSIEDPEE